MLGTCFIPASQVLGVVAGMLVATAPGSETLAADLPPPQIPNAAAPVQMQQAAQPQQSLPMQTQQPGQGQQSAQAKVSGRVTYSRLLEFIDEGSVKKVDFYDQGRTAIIETSIGGRTQSLMCELPGASSGLVSKMTEKNVAMEVHTPEKPNPLLNVLGDIAFPLILILGLLFLRSRGGAGGGLPGMPGQKKKEIQMTPSTGVTFADVAGIEEAKQELTEVVDFLKAPERFIKVGAKIPGGVLLTGPPGTGKTLMAKALAGEAGVPFIQASAAEFIEMFVGVGASRVRDIFKQAKENAPCIVFIDEIDAIGRQRGAGMGGGNDEREQTLNQILTEMDGFENNSGVLVVAATNRSDILDNALLRPGRFDRKVQVDVPDAKGREEILKVHVKNKPLEEDLALKDIAQRTTGMSGADLENLMNESAILAARRSKKAISMAEVNDATDRILAGIAGTDLANPESKKKFAYNEAGKALVGTLLAHHDPVGKVTLIPRGSNKSLTWFTPAQDQSLISANSLNARLAGSLGGRAAEQIVYGSNQVTTLAGNDLQKVEQMARFMVTKVGMTDLGVVMVDDGGMMGPDYSEDLGSKIDAAIKDLSDQAYLTSLKICMENRACLDKLAQQLVEDETLTGDKVREVIAMYAKIPEKDYMV